MNRINCVSILAVAIFFPCFTNAQDWGGPSGNGKLLALDGRQINRMKQYFAKQVHNEQPGEKSRSAFAVEKPPSIPSFNRFIFHAIALA